MARILPVTLEEYYRDPCTVPSLSQSIAKLLVTKSPLHAWTAHPRLGNAPRESTPAQNEGTLIHKLLLGKGQELEVLDVDEYRTNHAKALRDNAIAAGKLPVKAKNWNAAQAAAETIRGRLFDAGVDLVGDTEVPIEWYEPGFDGYVLCRGALDLLNVQAGGATIVDVKKIASADDDSCSKYAYQYCLDIQEAAYRSGVEKLYPQLVGRVDVIFAFVELEAPYGVNPQRLTGEFREMGTNRWNRGVALWERCTRESRWPGYTETIGMLEPPGWARAREEYINGSL